MKKSIFAFLVLALLSIQVAAVESMTLTGVIIDNRCASMAGDTVSEFVKTHTKQCTLMKACVASGYAILVDGKLHKFDQESNEKIVEFLKKEDSKLQVVVTVEKSGDELSLLAITNQ